MRFVLVPGLTDDPADIAHIADFAAQLGNVEPVEVLPLHQVGRFKWQTLGIRYDLVHVEPPTSDAVDKACAIFRARPDHTLTALRLNSPDIRDGE